MPANKIRVIVDTNLWACPLIDTLRADHLAGSRRVLLSTASGGRTRTGITAQGIFVHIAPDQLAKCLDYVLTISR